MIRQHIAILRLLSVLTLLFWVQSCRTPELISEPAQVFEDPAQQVILESVNKMLEEVYETGYPVTLTTGVQVSRIEIEDNSYTIDVFFNERLSYSPMRPESTKALYDLFDEYIPRRYQKYDIKLFSLDEPIENLIPNFYRLSHDDYDHSRMPYTDEFRPRPVVLRNGRHFVPRYGLEGRQIALWHSHGWYFNQHKKRWEWQRPRLFQTVEDLLPMSFTLPYLIPMLENAGAYVWTPRERDMQSNEVIVDFDGSSYKSRIVLQSNSDAGVEDNITINADGGIDGDGYVTENSWISREPGFSIGFPPYESGINPFQQGSFRMHRTSADGDASVQWIPDIPENGDYAVYVSYASVVGSVDDAQYSVYHRGGRTDFTVNQTIGGGTWIYLGHFEFDEGVNPGHGRVELTNKSSRLSVTTRQYDYNSGEVQLLERSTVITADAVRFGGGMGNIAREGQTGGRPRYLEAARYNMQFSGMPDSLVYGVSKGQSDVVDDFRGRGEWVNYLKGAPYGPNLDRDVRGLGIPIDLSMAFHTDAGITRNDTVIGTLMIYSIEDLDSLRKFPDQISRLANRDFADIMQTELVSDIRALWDPDWTRRHLFNRMYSEALRPNVPALLLELLSHQNFLDMQFALDPRFRFDVSRTIYKSMLRFIADRHQQDYVVQPLPVSHFRIIPADENDILLRWRAVSDPLEPTADPEKFIVYIKTGDLPFDFGRMTSETEIRITDLEPGVMYQFKVIAANDGGKSFPSETLAVSLAQEPARPLLIVNGFERISGPALVDEAGFKGFANFIDRGVPDRFDISFTGDQFDYDPESEWLSNDAPGHGASYADFETRIIPGNRFDFPAVYGESLVELGIPFVSASVASIKAQQVDMNNFDAVILIMGNQKSTCRPKQNLLQCDPEFQVFPRRLREEIERYLHLGGRLFISGAHVGTDAAGLTGKDTKGLDFIRQTLGYTIETNYAVRTGGVLPVPGLLLPDNFRFSFNTSYNPDVYMVDAPDAIEPYRESMAGTTGSSDTAADQRVDSSRSDINPSGPETVLRYEENGFSAGVGYKSDRYAVVTFGFPFETVIDASERREVLSGVLNYLGIVY